MIKIAYKYYLQFPPAAQKAIHLSICVLMGAIGIDYEPDPENILIGFEQATKNIFK